MVNGSVFNFQLQIDNYMSFLFVCFRLSQIAKMTNSDEASCSNDIFSYSDVMKESETWEWRFCRRVPKAGTDGRNKL